jgi:peptidoglycan/xylan/chitin deacetylase (PgdA/CDA1 family)
MRFAILALPAVLLVGLVACGDGGGESRIPDGTVVLTFDDAVRNHLTVVAPLLEKHGFGATFFITAFWMNDGGEYLTWPEIATLHRRGFEIGNHTWTHWGFHDPKVAAKLPGDTARMTATLERVGIPRPTSFAWPGSAFGPEALEWLRENGYAFARRGMRPEAYPGRGEPGPGTAYDPTRHDPLLVPAYEVGPDWTLETFRRVLGYARDGRAVVLQLHGIPDRSNPDVSVSDATFRGLVDILAAGSYRVVALRDLGRWVDPSVVPEDPLSVRAVP